MGGSWEEKYNVGKGRTKVIWAEKQGYKYKAKVQKTENSKDKAFYAKSKIYKLRNEIFWFLTVWSYVNVSYVILRLIYTNLA